MFNYKSRKEYGVLFLQIVLQLLHRDQVPHTGLTVTFMSCCAADACRPPLAITPEDKLMSTLLNTVLRSSRPPRARAFQPRSI